MQTLLIATHNQGKLREYRALLADLPLRVIDLAEAGIQHDVPETGDTFAANALLKATAYAQLSGFWTWADDSGLEVDALEGAPGVYSARYAGPGASDADRYTKLVRELQAGAHPHPWTARFRCAVALVTPDGRQTVVEDRLEGEITPQPRGEHGFGYDPVFWLPNRQVTLAQVPAAVKNQISHRGKAAVQAKAIIAAWLAENRAESGSAAD